MPTIRDVASKAGVSIKTVSRVLNKDAGVRGETRLRVERAIAALDYTPDPAARVMRSGRSGMIGLINDDVTSTPYAVEIVRGVHDACAQAGVMLLISNTAGERAVTERAVSALVARKAEGIIFATRFLRELQELPATRRVPVVLVNCLAPARDRPAILPDDEGGSFEAADYLIGLGHRDIALVSINPAILAAKRRADGFRAALRQHGLRLDEDRIQPGQHFETEGEPFTVGEAVARIMSGERPVTAILCGTDAIAMRACNELRARGLRIPEDISVVGFDNFTMIAEGFDPPLTSVALPYYDMGRRAVAWLRDERPAATDEMAMPCSLVVRGSCRPPPASERRVS